MKHFLLFWVYFLTLPTFSQKQKNTINTDSVAFYLNLSTLYKNNLDYPKALSFSTKAKEFAEKNNFKKELADSYLALGGIYFLLNKTDNALVQNNKALTIYKSLEPSINKAYCLYSLGVCNREKKSFNLAESYFNQAIAEYNLLNIKNVQDIIVLQKGIIHNLKGETELARNNFNSIISKKTTTNLIETKAEAYYQLADMEAPKNKLTALRYLEKAYFLTQNNTNNTFLKLKILKQLSHLYNETQAYSQSLKYLTRFVNLNDSIMAVHHQNVTALTNDKFIAEEQLQFVKQSDTSSLANQKSAKFSKLISILSISLIAILSLLSLSLYKNNIIRTKTNELLKNKNLELEAAKTKAEKASKARAEFLSTVSHELRTPLNAINGITHILIEDNPKPEQLNYLNSLKFSGEYLLTFINDILEINRVESDMIEVEKIPFDLRDLLENILNSFTEIANKNKTVYHLEIDEKIPSVLIGDPTKLSQIFINLINNAIKFTKNGNVWIVANLKKEKSNTVKIYFEVRDSGIGIPKEKQDTIFDSFTQGSVEINRKYGGTGLGLAIVKRLVHLLGGKIYLESATNYGTRFYFDLRFKKGLNHLEKNTTPSYDAKWLEDKKILLVEDNKINQMITQKMLERKKMTCFIIENGEEAVSHLKENKYDLVLMDVHLPGINGTTATAQIRQFDTETPIIALTAISLDENRDMLLSYGMNEVITKPFNPDKFYEIIATTIGQKINTV